MDPWQALVLRNALGQRRNGRWAAPEVGLIVPRQSGKGVCVEAAALGAMYLHRAQIVYTAHLMSTSRKMRERIQNLIEASPDLEREVKQIRISNEEQSIALKSKARIDFVARSGASARGWSGDMVFFDEAFALATDHVGALMPIMFARQNWQLWYVSSAGKTTSHALRRVRQRGLEGDPGLCYFEWSADEQRYRADPGAGAIDPELWVQANPGLGIRIMPETIRLAQRSMDPEEFAREVLGIWDDPHGTPLIDPGVWARLIDPGSQISGLVVFAVDVSPDLKSGAIVASGFRDDRIPHIEITGRDELLDHRLGVDWMLPRIVELNNEWSPAAWVIDAAGPAGALITDLAEAGIEPYLVNSRELAQACGNFLMTVTASGGDGLRHLGQTGLAQAIRAAQKRDIGDGAWAFGRRKTDQDISPLVAAALALHGLAIFAPEEYDVLESVF